VWKTRNGEGKRMGLAAIDIAHQTRSITTTATARSARLRLLEKSEDINFIRPPPITGFF
jgi:hypothetical protein